jgi:hypothetical protein
VRDTPRIGEFSALGRVSVRMLPVLAFSAEALTGDRTEDAQE